MPESINIASPVQNNYNWSFLQNSNLSYNFCKKIFVIQPYESLSDFLYERVICYVQTNKRPNTWYQTEPQDAPDVYSS